MTNSLTNKIVANIKKTTVDVNSFVNTNSVVCIDTSNNRIGINTKNPRYAIDICGTDPNKLIYVNKLIIERDAIIRDISCINNIDASTALIRHINYTTMTGNTIRINNLYTISADIIDLSISRLVSLKDLSSVNLDVSYLRVSNRADVSGNMIVKGNLTVVGALVANFTEQETDTFTITELATIAALKSEKAAIKNIDCSTIKVDICANFYGDVFCKNNIDISLGSFITLSGNLLRANQVTANQIRGIGISCERLVTQDCSVNGILQVATIQGITGNNIISDGQLNVTGIGATFDSLKVTGNITITNTCDIYDLTIINRLDFSANASLILPNYSLNNNLKQSNSIAVDVSDSSINIIKFYNSNNSWSNIYTKTHYASLDLNRTIPGNDISSTSGVPNGQANYFIESSNNLIINSDSTRVRMKYKYIPLSFKYIDAKIANSGNNTFNILDISTNKRSGKVTVPDINGIYEINSNITMRYLNKIPGDVEPNTYTFGIYSLKTNSINLDTDISYIYIENKNNILAFDNSFNYSSSSLNYVGPLFNSANAFIFLISSTKDLDYLVIDTFNGSIKLLNY